ncbi:MAG: dihydropteroate synthase [Chromatiales bacterium]|nr:MAG: dihydropteroate synthase [Chromatiales bacterium]
MQLNCGHRLLDLSRPVVMGILNVTPDSFSDGGAYPDTAQAAARARQMVEEGAELIDVGGESTRPGAAAVDSETEISRVVPVIEAIRASCDAVISIDTSKPEVMQAAVAAGAAFINDVRALREPGALEVAASLEVPVCLMHMQGQPRTMQDAPDYDDVVTDVAAFLGERVESCCRAGMARERLVIDPGFGFGKTLRHNLLLLNNLHRLTEFGLPVLVGISRKSMIGAILDRAVDQRLYGSLAAATISLMKGASIIRTHDVAPTVDALRVVTALGAVRK